jgi:hypothetical protein
METLNLTQEEIKMIQEKRMQDVISQDLKRKQEAIEQANKNLNDRLLINTMSEKALLNFYEKIKSDSKLRIKTETITFSESVTYKSFSTLKYTEAKERMDKLKIIPGEESWDTLKSLTVRDRLKRDIVLYGDEVTENPIQREVESSYLYYDQKLLNKKGEYVHPFRIVCVRKDEWKPEYTTIKCFRMCVRVSHDCDLDEGFFSYAGKSYNNDICYSNIVNLEKKMEICLKERQEDLDRKDEDKKRKAYANAWFVENFPGARIYNQWESLNYDVTIEGVGRFRFHALEVGQTPWLNMSRSHIESKICDNPIALINSLKNL